MAKPVGVALRAVAAIVDTVLLGAVGYFLATVSGGITADGFELKGGPFFLWLIMAMAYFIVMEAMIGATLGKLLVGLRVVALGTGEPIDWQASTVRNVLRLIDGLFFYLVGAIVIWLSAKKQRLGDRVAGTVVARRVTRTSVGEFGQGNEGAPRRQE
jgi:uncharacterized RDD family membrane protein YckC